MLTYELHRDEGIFIVTPDGPLEASDFERLAQELDPYIESHGELRGLMIDTKSFPGWTDFAALLAHLKFVWDHHQKIAKVAAATDSGFLSIAPRIAAHFVRAEVKHFDYKNKDAALAWLKQRDA